MIVVAKATWPVIKDWEMKEWGVQEVARIGGGEAVRKGSGESREAVGVWMNVSLPDGVSRFCACSRFPAERAVFLFFVSTGPDASSSLGEAWTSSS